MKLKKKVKELEKRVAALEQPKVPVAAHDDGQNGVRLEYEQPTTGKGG